MAALEPGRDLTRFTSQRVAGEPVEIQFVARSGPGSDRRGQLAASLAAHPWSQLQHAYGPASEVPALLYAVSLGTDRVRDEAWWELWGNIHHQGTVYEATPPCVPHLARIAEDPAHPDQVNALSFLRQIAVGEGEFALQTRAAVEQQVPSLIQSWPQQDALTRRAVLLLAAAFPHHLARHASLVDLVPEHLRLAWDELLAAGGDPGALDEGEDVDLDDVMDRQDELEQWALAGWNEPSTA